MTSPTTTDPWPIIRGLVGWLDNANGHDRLEQVLRVLKVTEEAGEAAEAVIGTLGQNPRKGVTHSRDDVADELADVIVTAMVALHSWSPDPAAAFERKLAAIALRAGECRNSLAAVGESMA